MIFPAESFYLPTHLYQRIHMDHLLISFVLWLVPIVTHLAPFNWNRLIFLESNADINSRRLGFQTNIAHVVCKNRSRQFGGEKFIHKRTEDEDFDLIKYKNLLFKKTQPVKYNPVRYPSRKSHF